MPPHVPAQRSARRIDGVGHPEASAEIHRLVVVIGPVEELIGPVEEGGRGLQGGDGGIASIPLDRGRDRRHAQVPHPSLGVRSRSRVSSVPFYENARSYRLPHVFGLFTHARWNPDAAALLTRRRCGGESRIVCGANVADDDERTRERERDI